MRQTPSDMRRIGQARPLRIKGGECKCVVYACVLYRAWVARYKRIRNVTVNCVCRAVYTATGCVLDGLAAWTLGMDRRLLEWR